MNTIIMNETQYDEIMAYEGELNFENFIFNDFKVIVSCGDFKNVYLVHLDNEITKITMTEVLKNGLQKSYKVVCKLREDGEYDILEKPKGRYIDGINKSIRDGKVEPRVMDKIDLVDFMVCGDIIFIERLRNYIMNESYKRRVINKEIKSKKCIVNEDSEKNTSSKKNKKDTVTFLLNEVVNYIGGRSKTGFHCTCECWSVRGHFRRYKNGNIIWINQYEKGAKRNTGCKLGSKVYKI